MPRVVINNLQQLDELAERISRSAAETAQRIGELAATNPGLAFLHALRFEPHGRQPLGTGPLNLIEQLNQTFTYLASLAGTRILFREFPADGPYTLNLGTTVGPDIASSRLTRVTSGQTRHFFRYLFLVMQLSPSGQEMQKR